MRVVHLAAVTESVFPRVQVAMTNTDMSAHWKWSDEILAGDLLGLSTYHQYPDWMRELAPLETWYRWWGSEKTFYREPLYPYFLAFIRFVLRGVGAGSSILAVLGIQLAIGALQPLVLFAIARRLLDARAGLLAAALGAIYGPFVFFESSLLRDWIPPLVDPLLLVAVLRARDRARTVDWALAGALFGAAVLVHSSLLLFLPLCLAWIAWEERRLGRPRLRPVAILLAGFALAFAPLVARNAAVGAPAFAITNRAPEAIIQSNAPDAVPVGMPHPPSLTTLLEAAQGSAFRALVATVEAYDGKLGGLVRVQWLKLWGAFDTFEHPDNLDYEFGRSISPVLRVAPGFAVVGLLGVAGLLLAVRSGGAHRLVLLYVVAALGGQMVTVIVGRYRLGMVAVLIATGACFAVASLDRLRDGGLRRAAPALAILPLLVLAHWTLQPAELRDPAREWTGRDAEYGFSVQVLCEEGRFEEALAAAELYRTRGRDRPTRIPELARMTGFAQRAWAEALLAQGNREAAREHALASRDAFDIPGQDPRAWLSLGTLFLEVGMPGEAARWIERFLAEVPESPLRDRARAMLEAARR